MLLPGIPFCKSFISIQTPFCNLTPNNNYNSDFSSCSVNSIPTAGRRSHGRRSRRDARLADAASSRPHVPCSNERECLSPDGYKAFIFHDRGRPEFHGCRGAYSDFFCVFSHRLWVQQSILDALGGVPLAFSRRCLVVLPGYSMVGDVELSLCERETCSAVLPFICASSTIVLFRH